jgi:tRNA(adenine34) deaminase
MLPPSDAPIADMRATAPPSAEDRWMSLALEEARYAVEHQDVPIGCVVVSAQEQLLARAHNRREVDRDPTAHAEILALRQAASRVGRWRLDGASVYVTLEPCAMCAGALVNARIARLVYGATDPKAGAVESLFSLGTDARLNHRFEVMGGLLAGECAGELQRFFAARR